MEYARANGWQFHCKGVWVQNHQQHPTAAAADWMLSVIGSGNLGHRSLHRDLEAQLYILTRNRKMIAELQKVCDFPRSPTP